jgi:hypothetical protein
MEANSSFPNIEHMVTRNLRTMGWKEQEILERANLRTFRTLFNKKLNSLQRYGIA